MYDSDFKKLEHKYKSFNITHRGHELIEGYKPDVVLNKNNNYVIMECEHSTSRKHFLGGFIKASKFLIGSKKGILIFVIFEKRNTSVRQIYDHLKPYFYWVEPLTNLERVYFISDNNYCIDGDIERIDSLSFKNKALVIK